LEKESDFGKCCLSDLAIDELINGEGDFVLIFLVVLLDFDLDLRFIVLCTVGNKGRN